MRRNENEKRWTVNENELEDEEEDENRTKERKDEVWNMKEKKTKRKIIIEVTNEIIILYIERIQVQHQNTPFTTTSFLPTPSHTIQLRI